MSYTIQPNKWGSPQQKAFTMTNDQIGYRTWCKNSFAYRPFDNSIAVGDILHVAAPSSGAWFYLEEWGGETKSFCDEVTARFPDDNVPYFIDGVTDYSERYLYLPFTYSNGTVSLPAITNNLSTALAPWTHTILKTITFEFPSGRPVAGAEVTVTGVETETVTMESTFTSMQQGFAFDTSTENLIHCLHTGRTGVYWSYNGSTNLITTQYQVRCSRYSSSWQVNKTATQYYPTPETESIIRAMQGNSFYF